MNLIVDNKKNKISDLLIEHISEWSKISVLSSYFTIFAYNKLKAQLKDIEEFRFLFLEPTFIQETDEKREFYIERINREKNIWGNDFEIKMRNELIQTSIAKECANWIKKKAQFKSIKKYNATDAKAIHVVNDKKEFAIQWTLDFTSSGLWFSPSKKMELNVYSEDTETTQEALKWFNEIRNDKQLTQDVKEEVLKNIQCLYKENSPELLYFITLYNLFKDYLEEISEDNIIKTRTNFKDSLVWNKLYKFQKDWVIWSIDKLERFGGCILADSVGLGKTFEALAVIKYYELRNHRVLVIAPKKLRDNWSLYRENDKRNLLLDDRFAYDVLNHTDLNRYKWMSGSINLEMINRGNYDLVVIDESHNFRNNDARKDKVSRYQRLMRDIIKLGVKTKVLMLSATPINNKMNDLKNQIAFITEGDDKHLANFGIPNIALTLKTAQGIFNTRLKLPEWERKLETLLVKFNIDYFKLLDSLTIARSRKHIEKYYNIEDIGKFPERLKPINIKSDIDISWEFPPLADINKSIKKLNLSVYSLLAYVRPEKKKKYEDMYNISVRWWQSVFKQTDRENSLIHLMRVNILKRLESSIYAFEITLNNVLKQINKTLDMISEFESTKSQKEINIDFGEINKELIEEDEEMESLSIGNKVQVLLEDMDLIRRREHLEDDKKLLDAMRQNAQNVTPERDAKLADLKDAIIKKIQNPINPNNKKVVIFSSFADTTHYLYANIASWVQENHGLYSAMVTWWWPNKVSNKSMRTDFSSILINFSPRSKERSKIYPEMTEDIDILIATDCISEWQNLQDCDYLINYDIHWNPVRIIQRFGRIDRIWSINTQIQLVNFRPNIGLDEYINLEARVRWRMVLLDVSATGEDNIIEKDESKDMNDLQYRKKQLEQIQNEVVDIEDISWGISITDLTMNDFKMELADYAKDNKEMLEKSPKGMYAITTLDGSWLEGVSPWVIYTLRQINTSQLKSEEPNALHPYYMIYISQEGEVKYNYLQAKMSLDIYKKLCSWQKEALQELVDQFNDDTKDGKKMWPYSWLLEQAIQNIVGAKQEKELESIFTLGTSSLATKSFIWLEDFELISFLIIK